VRPDAFISDFVFNSSLLLTKVPLEHVIALYSSLPFYERHIRKLHCAVCKSKIKIKLLVIYLSNHYSLVPVLIVILPTVVVITTIVVPASTQSYRLIYC